MFLICSNFSCLPSGKNPQRLTERMRENSEKFNCSGIEFPVSLKDISKFEKQNGINICVLVYDEKEGFYLGKPIGVGVDMSKVIKLLLISDKDENTHYCWIKDVSKLLSRETTINIMERDTCLRCLNSFASDESLQ